VADRETVSRDAYFSYEDGLLLLLEWIGRSHPRYTEALSYQQRLLENITQSRVYGDNETRRSERNEIIGRLNELTLDALDTSFNQLCGQASPIIPEFHDQLPPTQQVEILSKTAWQYIHKDLEQGIEYVQRALELGLRLWGRSIGIDDTGLDITAYLKRWYHFIESRPADDKREGLFYPHYFDMKGDYCEVGSGLFRAAESFLNNMEEAEEYVAEMSKAARYFLEMSERGLTQTYQEHRWENAIKDHQLAILSELESVSPKTAHALKATEGDIRWSISKGSLHIELFSHDPELLAELFSLEPNESAGQTESGATKWLSSEEMAGKGFDVEAIRSAICRVITDFPEACPVTASMPAKYAHLLD
jgi:hypothetical protein